MDIEEILKKLQSKYSLEVVKDTNPAEISVLIDALEFCEKNYKHNHIGVDKYIRGNHAMHNRHGEADLSQVYQNIRVAVRSDSRLLNYGHADLLTRSLLEYQRNGTPKNANTAAELERILQPIL